MSFIDELKVEYSNVFKHIHPDNTDLYNNPYDRAQNTPLIADMYAKYAVHQLMMPVKCMNGDDFKSCTDFLILNSIRVRKGPILPIISLVTLEGEVDLIKSNKFEHMLNDLPVYNNPYIGLGEKKMQGMGGIYTLLALNFSQDFYGTSEHLFKIYNLIHAVADNRILSKRIKSYNYFIIRALRMIKIAIAQLMVPAAKKLIRRSDNIYFHRYIRIAERVNKHPEKFYKWVESGDNVAFSMFYNITTPFDDLSYMSYQNLKFNGVMFLDRKSHQAIPRMKITNWRLIQFDLLIKNDYGNKFTGAIFLYWFAHTKVEKVNSYVFWIMHNNLNPYIHFDINEIDSYKSNLFYFLEMLYGIILNAWNQVRSRRALMIDVDRYAQALDIRDYALHRCEETRKLQHLHLLTSKSTLGSVNRHMERWHTELNKKKLGPLVEYKIPIKSTIINGFKITPLQTNHEVSMEGSGMSHCLASYNELISKGHYLAFKVEDEDGVKGRRGTLGAKILNTKGTYKVQLEQLRGKYNKMCDGDMTNAVNEFIKSLNEPSILRELELYCVYRKFYGHKIQLKI